MRTSAGGSHLALILIVDDSPTEVHVMKKALEKGGFKTAIAGDGKEGVRLAKDLKPDLIFMDIVMPGMNGYQATRAIASDPGTRSIPIVMVTSKGLETDRVWGLRQGAVDYMVKPVSPEVLVQKAQATLAA
jgi:twitching motility two-component system response regulator PilH